MVVALLTDFGTRDVYVGVMKAVIAGIAPGVTVIDLCHEVTPQAVDEGAFLLEQVRPYLPRGSVVCAVVDPKVGTARRAVAVKSGGLLWVGPDNGLLTHAYAAGGKQRAHEIRESGVILPHAGHTFHGRDVFAPAAAHLAAGQPLAAVGPRLEMDELVRLPEDTGRVVHVDHFGNLVTDLSCDDAPGGAWVRVGSHEVRRRVRAYGDAADGEVIWYAGSSGHVEVAVVNGSAAVTLGVERGEPASFEPSGS